MHAFNAFLPFRHSLQRITEGFRDPAWLHKAGWWALIIALLLRVGWGISVPVIPVSDSNAYDVFAQNIAAGQGFSWKSGELTAYWAVGTPAVYALIYSIFGHTYVPIVVLNIIVGLGTVALAMSLARRWLGPVPAVLTGWILAIWPLMIQFTTILASEMLFNFCVLAAFWVATMPGWKWLPRAVAAGVILAAAVYIRPIALLLAPVIYFQEAVIQRRLIRAGAACAVSCVVMIALILPWSLRNLEVFDRFVLVSTNAGTNFWMGNNPETTGSYMPEPETGIVNEAERDIYLKHKAWEYIGQEPLAFVSRTLKKAVLLHDRESIGVVWNEKGLEQSFGRLVLLPLKLISNIYWWLMLACAGYALILLLRQRTWLELLTLPPLIVWAYYAAVHSITVVGDRYHIPSDPFIAMLGAYAIFIAAGRMVAVGKDESTPNRN
ncbi:MAG: glycosyltransferase family 39 protein [Gammaproteobacteria bacterium]|nr:glycosyltransferase family 39 protein [Gammaproteobacteria bacterium]MBU1969727.1 glycosyltransferase family 39 protein [Gammaproteobacteria bacterium]